jgi:uncharacterized membrane protein
MAYLIFKMLHLLGVIVLIGNVTVSSFWKVFADRSGDQRIIAHAQRLVTTTDWVFTFSGIVLLVGGGFGATHVAGIPPFGPAWLVIPELLFLLSGLIWLFVLVPIQVRQARQARLFSDAAPIPAAYRRDNRLWLIWGIAATVPLIAALYVMIAKPW